MVVVRFLFAVLLGFVLGVGAMVYLMASGTADTFIRQTDVVEDLERQVRALELERDRLGRQLEDVVARASRMEKAFGDLEQRFQGLRRDEPPRAAPPPVPSAAPPTVAPGSAEQPG